MRLPIGFTRRRILIIIWLIPIGAAGVKFALHSQNHDFMKVPLARSAYLRSVVEPITIEECMNFDDGGSIGVIFRDARRQRYAACLESDWGYRMVMVATA